MFLDYSVTYVPGLYPRILPNKRCSRRAPVLMKSDDRPSGPEKSGLLVRPFSRSLAAELRR